jgi:hypothetical protein
LVFIPAHRKPFMPSKRKRTVSKASAAPKEPSPLPSEPIHTLSGNAESSFAPLAKKFLIPLAIIIVLAVAASVFYPYLSPQGGSPMQPSTGAGGNQQQQEGVPSSNPSVSLPRDNGTAAPIPSPEKNNSTSILSNATASNGSGNDIPTSPPDPNDAEAASDSGGTITSGTVSGTQGSSPQNGGSQQSGGSEQTGQNNSGGSGDAQDIIEPPLSTPDSPYANYFGITTGTLANATSGSQYSFALTAVGGTGSYTWYTSTLPPGLSLSQSGVIFGVPTQQGVYNVQITVSDGISASTQFLRVTVN